MDARILRTYHGPNPVALHPAILWMLNVAPDAAQAALGSGMAAFRACYPRAEPVALAGGDPVLALTQLVALVRLPQRGSGARGSQHRRDADSDGRRSMHRRRALGAGTTALKGSSLP